MTTPQLTQAAVAQANVEARDIDNAEKAVGALYVIQGIGLLPTLVLGPVWIGLTFWAGIPMALLTWSMQKHAAKLRENAADKAAHERWTQN